MDIERAIVKVGLEIEVPKWNGRKYQDVCGDLVDAEYMIGPKTNWKKHHKYHCNCEPGGCGLVRRGELVVPPLVSMTYDGSLPKTGAEFILSPVLLAETSLRDMVHEIWDIIVRDAVWTLDLPDYYDNGKASPSVHMHVSATAPNPKDSTRSVGSLQSDILHGLSLFAPELFMLADMTNVRRGLKFRLPTRDTIANDGAGEGSHHGFIHIRKAMPGSLIYVEWRLFEAAYEDWDYVEAAAYIAAALTRSFLDNDVLSRLLTVGYSRSYDVELLNRAAMEDNVQDVVDQLDEVRLNTLRELCLEQLDDDTYGYDCVVNLFSRLEAKT